MDNLTDNLSGSLDPALFKFRAALAFGSGYRDKARDLRLWAPLTGQSPGTR